MNEICIWAPESTKKSGENLGLDVLTILYQLRAMFKIEDLIWVSFWRALKFQPSRQNLRRWSKNIETKYKTRIKHVHDLYDTCFQYNVKN